MKKALALLLALVMTFALCACGGEPTGSSNPPADNSNPPADNSGEPGSQDDGTINFDEDPYEVSIQFVGLFEENKDIAAVEEAVNKITLEKINCTVDIVPVFIGDLPTTTSMGVAGGEKLDIVAVGLTSPMDSMVNDELLLPLDDLLASRGQGAMEATEHVAAAQKINGVTYAISGYPYAAMAAGFAYNKTMADEYGIKMHEGMTMEELTDVAATLKEHGVYLTTHGSSGQVQYKFYHGGDYFNNGAFGGILDPANSTEVVNVFDTKEMRDFWKTIKSWYDAGYLPADQLTDTTTSQEYFGQGKIFGCPTSYTVDQITAWMNPNFEAAVVQISDPLISTGSVVEFMLGIAANCERPDKAMDLINLMYTDPELANLMNYGVEGLDYVKVEGTENVVTIEGTNNADHNGYYAGFTHYGSPTLRKIMAPLTDDYYEELNAFENSATYSKTFGYFFDGTEFSAESGAISSVMEQKLPALNAGQVADVDAAVDDLVAALNDAGMADCIAANQAQLDAFLGK